MPFTKSCLLIDDDQDDQLIFSHTLQEFDKSIKFFSAENGLAALKRLEGQPIFRPDLIFLDINLPGMSGMDCLIRIRSNPELDNTPVIIYSTSSLPDHFAIAKKLGAIDFLTKPIDIDCLKASLIRLFRTHLTV
jgi:CheY-like chemotaxis protein